MYNGTCRYKDTTMKFHPFVSLRKAAQLTVVRVANGYHRVKALIIKPKGKRR